jgi:hypothetical protein
MLADSPISAAQPGVSKRWAPGKALPPPPHAEPAASPGVAGALLPGGNGTSSGTDTGSNGKGRE